MEFISSFFNRVKNKINSINDNNFNIDMSTLNTVEQLRALGYMYNEAGILKKVDAPDEGFTFQGQAHYEKLGDVVANEIQRRMREDYHLEEHWLPTDESKEKGSLCSVFTTPDILTSTAPLAVFICGTGAVVAGQWARSLCINNSLDEGSSLPEIKWALENKWSVLVMNNNMPMKTGTRDDTSNGRALHAWKRFVRPSPARTIAILAHSYGGINTCTLIDYELESGDRSVLDRIACIAFTDSVHDSPRGDSEEWFTNYLGHYRVRNWVQSDDPLDTEEDSYDCIDCVSAGHRKHEFTTCSARESVHKFMFENVTKFLSNLDGNKMAEEHQDNEEVSKAEDGNEEDKTEKKEEEEEKTNKVEDEKVVEVEGETKKADDEEVKEIVDESKVEDDTKKTNEDEGKNESNEKEQRKEEEEKEKVEGEKEAKVEGEEVKAEDKDEIKEEQEVKVEKEEQQQQQQQEQQGKEDENETKKGDDEVKEKVGENEEGNVEKKEDEKKAEEEIKQE